MMAFSKLNEKQQNTIYQELTTRIRSESQAMYETKVALADTIAKKKACAGQYKGRWSYLLDAWMRDSVDTRNVIEAINNEKVGDDLYLECRQVPVTIH